MLKTGEVHVSWNGTIEPKLPLRPVHVMFQEQVARTPDGIALSANGQTMTYRRLDEVTDHLAKKLVDVGVGPEKVVAVMVERSFFTVISILSILKAGGCYLALEHDIPAPRLEFILQDASPELVIANGCGLAKFAGFTTLQVLNLDTVWEEIVATNGSVPFATADIQPAHLAYISYTSGTTGNPKGVCVTHGSVARLVQGEETLTFTPETVFLQLAPIAFDASTLEIWGTLTNGGRLAIYSCGQVTPEGIKTVVEQEAVNTLWLTAGLFHLMINTNIEMFANVKHVLAGGDVISCKHLEKLFQKYPNITFTNGYGPTENTTFTTTWSTKDGQRPNQTVPIGTPINGTTVYILDAELQPVPVGTVGDLYTGGAGLARGYLQKPTLTADKFLPNPFSTIPGARMYQTGDQAKWNEDGTIEFLGRNDDQVKINGYRVETGEIEAVIKTFPEVADAVVVIQKSDADKRLIGYVTPKQTETPSDALITNLQAYLKEKLPSYMALWHIAVIAELPLTKNGKVDRNALPALSRKPRKLPYDYVAPTTPMEFYLARLWGELLDVEPVGIEDDFFELGGHSLIVPEIISQIGDELDVMVQSRILYLNPTLEALASAIDEAKNK